MVSISTLSFIFCTVIHTYNACHVEPLWVLPAKDKAEDDGYDYLARDGFPMELKFTGHGQDEAQLVVLMTPELNRAVRGSEKVQKGVLNFGGNGLIFENLADNPEPRDTFVVRMTEQVSDQNHSNSISNEDVIQASDDESTATDLGHSNGIPDEDHVDQASDDESGDTNQAVVRTGWSDTELPVEGFEMNLFSNLFRSGSKELGLYSREFKVMDFLYEDCTINTPTGRNDVTHLELLGYLRFVPTDKAIVFDLGFPAHHGLYMIVETPGENPVDRAKHIVNMITSDMIPQQQTIVYRYENVQQTANVWFGGSGESQGLDCVMTLEGVFEPHQQ